MMMKRSAQAVYLFMLVAVLAACAALGLPTADTFNQKVAVGYGTVTSIRNTATTLLQAKKISADDAQQIQGQADNARAGLDIARKTYATDPAGAGSKLTAITTALTALQAYLATKGN